MVLSLRTTTKFQIFTAKVAEKRTLFLTVLNDKAIWKATLETQHKTIKRGIFKKMRSFW